LAKRHIAPLERGRVRLRLLEEADLPMTLAWRNQDHIRKWFFHSHVITPDEHRAWYAKYQVGNDDFVFVIEETETLKRPVGQLALSKINWTEGRAEFGRLMIGDPAAKGLGLAKAATRILMEEALTVWELQQVYLEVLRTNGPALAIYGACGFIETERQGEIIEMSAKAIRG